ncbi:hypothetical protein K5X82_10260 [Halosquirtibacter xylanolyticus]|uniref:hypothetical protein n=1 Tax=Halosquirtibacter xylanolyticus TaxID=3374599 RepID=UPI003749313B|nr:hypothetical protein K5X82_10260 [Prolixibacteraceae bacterium]
MSKKVTTFLKVLLWVLMVTSCIIMYLLISNLSDPITAEGDKYITLGLNWSYTLLAFVSCSTILFSIRSLFLSGKDAILKSVGGLVAMIAVVAIAWAMGSDALPVFHGSDKLVASGELTASISHGTDMLLNTTYILMGLAAVAIVIVPPVLKLVRRN